MPTVELDIRQLAEEGGTNPIAPTTVTDAVLDEDGNTLTDILDELKAGLTIHTISQEVNAGADITITGLPTGYVVISFIGYNTQYSLTYEGMQLVKDGFQIIYQTNGIRIINGSNTKYTVTFRYVIPI